MAKYDLTKTIYINRINKRVKQLINKGATVELSEVNVRSMPQHKYIHVLCSYFALESGYSKEEVKQGIFKEEGGNYDIFVKEYVDRNTGEVKTFVRSVNSLSKEEASKTIDNFITYSETEAGIIMPRSDEYRFLSECIIEIDKHVRI